MKKLIVTMMLLAFISTATAQGMADKLAESVATHLSLNASQKQTVLKLYKADAEKQNQKRQGMMAKRSDKDRANREKATKSKKTRPTPKASGKSRKAKSATSSSDRFLMIAYGKAMANPTLKQELLKVFNEQQTAKWQQIGKR